MTLLEMHRPDLRLRVRSLRICSMIMAWMRSYARLPSQWQRQYDQKNATGFNGIRYAAIVKDHRALHIYLCRFL